MIQKMRKNARKKFGCRGKLPRFSPLAPEAAVREKARSKPLKYSLLVPTKTMRRAAALHIVCNCVSRSPSQRFKMIPWLAKALFAVLDGLRGAVADAGHAVGAVLPPNGLPVLQSDVVGGAAPDALRNPYLLTAGITYSVLFPCALPVFAVATHRHRRHLSAAVWAIVRDLSCICTLTTPVSCKRHPHPTARALRSVCLIYSPFSHCQPPDSMLRLLFLCWAAQILSSSLCGGHHQPYISHNRHPTQSLLYRRYRTYG